MELVHFLQSKYVLEFLEEYIIFSDCGSVSSIIPELVNVA
jgi:hypothetical protein